MSKYLIIAVLGVVGILVIIGTYYLLFITDQPFPSFPLLRQTEDRVISPEKTFSNSTEIPVSTTSSQSLSATTAPTIASSTASLESRVVRLESIVAGLDQKISALSKTTGQSTTQSSTKPTQYILLSPQSVSGDRNWVDVAASQVSLSPDNFPGYTSMQLEVSAKLVESIGQVGLRLYNLTDQTPVAGSTVATNATALAFLSSGGFKIPAGNKNYTLQMQSTLGNDATIQNARLRVNYN